MNKSECKKYIKRAYTQLLAQNKDITSENIEKSILDVMEEQSKEYIAFAKIAVFNMQNSANDVIRLKDLLEEIDILPKLYTPISAIEQAKKI